MPRPKLRMELHARENSKEARAILAGIIGFNSAYGGREDWRELFYIKRL